MKVSFLSIIYGFSFLIKLWGLLDHHWVSELNSVAKVVLLTDELQTTTVLLTDHPWSSGTSGWYSDTSQNYLRYEPSQKMDWTDNQHANYRCAGPTPPFSARNVLFGAFPCDFGCWQTLPSYTGHLQCNWQCRNLWSFLERNLENPHRGLGNCMLLASEWSDSSGISFVPNSACTASSSESSRSLESSRWMKFSGMGQGHDVTGSKTSPGSKQCRALIENRNKLENCCRWSHTVCTHHNWNCRGLAWGNPDRRRDESQFCVNTWRSRTGISLKNVVEYCKLYQFLNKNAGLVNNIFGNLRNLLSLCFFFIVVVLFFYFFFFFFTRKLRLWWSRVVRN